MISLLALKLVPIIFDEADDQQPSRCVKSVMHEGAD
jgi:hypothetical protein